MANVEDTHLTTNGSDTDTNEFTTASISPTAGRVAILTGGGLRGGGGAASDAPTIAGNGLTWTEITNVENPTSMRLAMYRAKVVSPSSGVVTITWADTQTDGCMWTITEFDNVLTTGTNASDAIVQSATQQQDAVTNTTVTLGAFADASNATHGVVFHNGTQTITEGSGFTELGEANSPRSIQGQWRNDNDTSVDWTWGTSQQVTGIGIELAFGISTGNMLLMF